ncbi:SDR family oxidoreductase [Flavobacteriaceae bacterium]|nr:SDR family oxidoreductase [Flavobacteriaceae bacterium]
MKTYVIIGASSGIGLGLASELVKLGNKVIGTFNSAVPTSTNGVEYTKLDVTDQEIDFSFLPDVIDGLVYCPGSINLLPFKRLSSDSFLEDYNLQVVGAIKVIQNSLKALKKGMNPSILMFSTVAVQHGFNFHTQVAASKGAIEGLTRSLAAELSPTIRVNSIAPSITNTALAQKLLSSEAKIEANAQRHPLKRVGEVNDIVSSALYLLNSAVWSTGTILAVDGGMSTLKV